MELITNKDACLKTMFSIILIFAAILSAFAEIIIIKQGVLNGTNWKARNGKIFNAFLGIPYAEPPIGELRLKAPVAAKGWQGMRDASSFPNKCIQKALDGNYSIGSEDCLNLNVYTPLAANKGTNYSVIIYLFGGAYKFNSNVDFGPQYIMENDVVLVMPNFRLGALGFMSTGDSIISGNFGLKDQSLALKWVQENIYDFGGDPNRVTLHGHSSGAISVHFHTFSSMSKGLFHKVILQSGTSFCSLSYFGPDVCYALAKEFSIRAGCTVFNSSDILSCVMAMDAEQVVFIPEEMYIWSENPFGIFRPCIESANVENPFITKFPQDLNYQSINLPWLIGMTTGEGATKAASYLVNDGAFARELDEYYELLFPITLSYLWDTEPKDLDFISKTIRSHYFRNNSISSETADALTNMYTHGGFGLCTMNAIHSYPGPKYVYWYDYRANYSSQFEASNYPEVLGVSHGDDINLIFYVKKSADVLTPQDVNFSRELVKRFVNFVDTSNPNQPRSINESMISYWNSVSSDKIEYLLINLNGTMNIDLYKGIYEFWRSLPIGSKYYNG